MTSRESSYFGDTGAGKTSFVRQILGKHALSFPSVRRKRTTVAVTEYIVVSDGPYKAAILLKAEDEVQRNIIEILEDALDKAYMAHLRGDLKIRAGEEESGREP